MGGRSYAKNAERRLHMPPHNAQRNGMARSARETPPDGACTRPPNDGDASLLRRGECAGEPIEALVETVAGGGARALDEPLPVPQVVEPQLLSDLRRRHGVGEVLLVREDEQHRLAHLLLAQHFRELLPGVLDSVAVAAVDHVDQPVCALVIVAPQLPDLVLAAHVPHGEAQVLVLHRLDVEADGRDGRHDLAELELVQDRGLARCIEADHEDAHLLLTHEALPDLREGEAHGAARLSTLARVGPSLCGTRVECSLRHPFGAKPTWA
mmetsp:Transcript_123679/g.346365  ORF Transcript_123679/g.346365 Transcript_123679/m.346365 type:complete len:267 (+) Transcript_123679:81-881(+)